jgi:hypothetical protein
MFKASIKNLERYAAKLSSEVMELIEMETLRLLMPERYRHTCRQLGIEPRPSFVPASKTLPGGNNEHFFPTPETSSDAPLVLDGIPCRCVWTVERITEFVEEFNVDQKSATEKFGISLATAKRYYSKWKGTYGKIPVDMSQLERGPLPTSTEIGQAISKVSNRIRDYLRDMDLLEDIRSRGYLRTSHKPPFPQEFYTFIGNAIYRSLLSFFRLEVDKVTREPIVKPKVTADTPYLDTWWFLDMMYHDMRVSKLESSIEALETYRELFGDCGSVGIHADWLPLLAEEIVREPLKVGTKKEFTLVPEGIAFIVDLIKDCWCYDDTESEKENSL